MAMTNAELLAMIRDHATKTADPDQNGWDHISEFLSDQDILHELEEGNCTTWDQALAHFERIAKDWHDYNR